LFFDSRASVWIDLLTPNRLNLLGNLLLLASLSSSSAATLALAKFFSIFSSSFVVAFV